MINAPSRLDKLTQQMVDLTARLTPAEQTLAGLQSQFSASALASVSDNVDEARERLAFAERNIDTGRELVARPANRQTGLVDAIHAAEAALGQARTLLDAVDSAATDINRAISSLPGVLTDAQRGSARPVSSSPKAGSRWPPSCPRPATLRSRRSPTHRARATPIRSAHSPG